MTTTQRIYGKHGTAEVEISVDYGKSPPTIARYDIVGDVYEASNELVVADAYHVAARWISGGFDVRNGGMTEAHRRDLHCAAELAFAAASKRWRVFRRRLAEATAAWSESIRREEAEARAFAARVVETTGFALETLPRGVDDDLLGGQILAQHNGTYVVTYGYPDVTDEETGEVRWLKRDGFRVIETRALVDCASPGVYIAERVLRETVRRVKAGEVRYLSDAIEQCGPECRGGCAWEFALQLLAAP